MKKLTFKVSMQEGIKITSIIKEINKISCRIHLDMENGIITAQDVNDDMIDNVIDLIDKYYTILNVDIDNIIEVTDKKEEISNVAAIEEETVKTETEIVEGKAVHKKEAEVLEPQSEDDLIIKKVEFQNNYIENILNKLLKTAYWAMYKKNAFEKEIGNYIYTCIMEVSLRYHKSEWKNVPASIGDIVECNYGTHLPGEINGAYVHGIVCDILEEGMVYVVPITKMDQETIYSKSYLKFSAPEDAEYKSDMYKGGTALLDKGKYIHVARVNSIIGRTTESFFSKLLKKLASTFDFTKNFSKSFELESENEDECVGVFEEKIEDSVFFKEAKVPEKKVGTEESVLLELFGPALEKLDKNIPVSEQIESFLKEIRMDISENLLVQSFIIACNIKKISYEYIVINLHEIVSNMSIYDIKDNLKQQFKNWLKQYPELAEKCPKISLMSLLKVVAKRFK